jgi:hypothetical protein
MDLRISKPCEYDRSVHDTQSFYVCTDVRLASACTVGLISFIFSVREFIFHRSVVREYHTQSLHTGVRIHIADFL